jgi:hypothetical protein
MGPPGDNVLQQAVQLTDTVGDKFEEGEKKENMTKRGRSPENSRNFQPNPLKAVLESRSILGEEMVQTWQV